MTYNTEKRTEILAFISKNKDRVFTIEEICSAVTPDGRGRSTVYRIISKLTEQGLVRRISDGKTRRVNYQYLGDGGCRAHLHLKCKNCGALVHLDGATSHFFESVILSSKAFAIDSGITLSGLCRDCRTGGA